MITDKMGKLENILKEKTSHLEKLKGELSVLTKSSLDNTKKLKNNGKHRLTQLGRKNSRTTCSSTMKRSKS